MCKNGQRCDLFKTVPFDTKFRPTVQILRPQDPLRKKKSSDVYNAVFML